MRQVILDTETTGLSPTQGHRIIEIGGVELLHRRLTGRTFHAYLQPDRKIDAAAIQVHGITDEYLTGKPRFNEIVEDFKRFIKGAELIIHNAPFDVGFIENEFLLLADEAWQDLSSFCQIVDTLQLARKKHPGQRNNLDALCKRYNIDNQHREKHGALLDAEILAHVYLAMTGGQNTLLLEEKTEHTAEVIEQIAEKITVNLQNPFAVLRASNQEILNHEAMLTEMEKKGKKVLWRELDEEPHSH